MTFLSISLTDWLGYVASLGVLLSFVMTNIKTLRIVNTIGCGFFVAYGFMLNSWPIIITNVAIIGVNVFYLSRKPKLN